MRERPLDVAADGRLFPRETLLAAVAGADWRDRPVRAAALALFALGLACVALGTPIARPLAAGEVAWTASGGANWLHLPHLLAGGLARAGVATERAWYVVSALGAALSFPALYALARVVGAGGALGLSVALVVASAPVCVAGAQLPTDFGFGVTASAALLAAALARGPKDAVPYGAYVRRCALVQWAALWLHAESAVFALPLIGAYAAAGRSNATRAFGVGVALSVGALGAGLASVAARTARLDSFDARLAELGPPALWLALATAPLALCAASLLGPFPTRAEEERPAPTWLRASVPFALGALALGAWWTPLSLGTALVPLATLALANAANRCLDPIAAARLLLVVLCASLAGNVAVQTAARRMAEAPFARIHSALSGGPRIPEAELNATLRYLVQFRFARRLAEVTPQ